MDMATLMALFGNMGGMPSSPMLPTGPELGLAGMDTMSPPMAGMLPGGPVGAMPAMAPPQEAYRGEMPQGTPYQEPYRSEPAAMGQPMSLGAALEPSGGGVPMPRPRPAEAPGPSAGAPAAGGDALLKTLQGVKAPAAPVPQKVGTPNLPALQKIQSGGFADLLASLGIGPQTAMAGLKLPSTLGQALGGK